MENTKHGGAAASHGRGHRAEVEELSLDLKHPLVFARQNIFKNIVLIYYMD